MLFPIVNDNDLQLRIPLCILGLMVIYCSYEFDQHVYWGRGELLNASITPDNILWYKIHHVRLFLLKKTRLAWTKRTVNTIWKTGVFPIIITWMLLCLKTLKLSIVICIPLFLVIHAKWLPCSVINYTYWLPILIDLYVCMSYEFSLRKYLSKKTHTLLCLYCTYTYISIANYTSVILLF